MRLLLAVVAPCYAIVGCLPSISFSTEPSDAAPEHAANDGSGADAGPPGDASGDSTTGAMDSAPGMDSTAGDVGATDTGGVDSPAPDSGPGITLDPGFPVTAEIDDATGMTLSKVVSVPGGGRMLVAVVVWGQHGGSGVWPVTFASPDLTWTNRVQSVAVGPSYPQAVGVGIWTAWAGSALASETVTATAAENVSADAVIVVYSLAGASQTTGATGTNNGFSSAQAPLSVTVDAQAAGSLIVGGLLDGDANLGVRGNTLAGTMYDFTLGSNSDDSLAVGRLTTPTAGPGNVTLGQDQSFPYDVAAGLEILRQ